MYAQAVLPNFEIPYVGGLCEGYVEGTVGQATLPTPKEPMTYGVYRSATQAWVNLPGKHTSSPPKALRVALYFTLGSNPNGHTAILLEDGRVASSSLPGYHTKPYIYKNLQSMIDDYAKNNNGCTYLGWTEYIGKVQVISKGVNMGMFDEGARKDFEDIMFRTNSGLFKEFVGMDYRDAVYKIKDSKDFKARHYVNKGDLNNYIGRIPTEQECNQFQIQLGPDIAKQGGGVTHKDTIYQLLKEGKITNISNDDNQDSKKIEAIKNIINE